MSLNISLQGARFRFLVPQSATLAIRVKVNTTLNKPSSQAPQNSWTAHTMMKEEPLLNRLRAFWLRKLTLFIRLLEVLTCNERYKISRIGRLMKLLHNSSSSTLLTWIHTTQTQPTAEKRLKEIYLILLSIPRELLLYSNNPVIHSRISVLTTRLTSLERLEVYTTGPWEEVHNLKIATILSQMPLR